MSVLALELSTGQGSLAWFNKDVQIVRNWPNDRKNSGLFFENLQSIVAKCGPPEKIIVGLGPGSYAGVRIAISAAIGIARAASVELFGYPSICAIDVAADDYFVIGDARRNSFYLARVTNRNLVGGFDLFSETELREKLAGLGTIVPLVSSDRLTGWSSVEEHFPSARILAQLGQDPARKLLLPPIEPIYLREPHVTMPKQ